MDSLACWKIIKKIIIFNSFFEIYFLNYFIYQIVFYLVEQIQLNWVAGVNVGVVVEVFALQQQNVDLCDTLFAKGFAMVHPMH